MGDNFTTDELMTRAISLLNDSYDPKVDSFFVVVTKDGKDQTSAFNGEQAIVGELNLKSVSAFIVQTVSTLCASLRIHPFMFISRHITAHFIDSERVVLNQLVTEQAKKSGDPRVVDRELVEELVENAETAEKDRDIFVVASSSMDIEN